MFLVMTSESVKAQYERARRRRHSDERRVYQVLFPWLKITRPEVFDEFDAFFNQLSERNPCTKNLTTTNDFKYFCRHGKGGYYVFLMTFLNNLLKEMYVQKILLQRTISSTFVVVEKLGIMFFDSVEYTTFFFFCRLYV